MYIENQKIANILSKYLNIELFDMTKNKISKNLNVSCSGSFLHYFIEAQFHLMKDIDFYPNNTEALNEINNTQQQFMKCPNSINVQIEIPYKNLFCKENFKAHYGSYKNGFINLFDFYQSFSNQQEQYNLYVKSTSDVLKFNEPILSNSIYQEYPKELLSKNFIDHKNVETQNNITLSIITNPKYILEDIEQTINKFDCCHVLWYFNLKTKQFFIKDTALLSLLSKLWIVNEDTDIQLAKNIYMFNRIEKHKKRFFVHDYMLYKYMELCFGNENVEEMFYSYDENSEPLTQKDMENAFYDKLSSSLIFSYENFVKYYNTEFNKIKSMYLIDNIDESDAFKLYKDTLELKVELFNMLKEYYPEYII